MFLLSLLTNKDSYNTQIIQVVNDTIFRKRFRVPGVWTGFGTLEPVPWNRFLRQITNNKVVRALFAENKVHFALAEQLCGVPSVKHFLPIQLSRRRLFVLRDAVLIGTHWPISVHLT